LRLQHVVETASPRRKRRSLIPKDEVIPLLPNAPKHKRQNFHKETMAKSTLRLINHRKEVKTMILVETHITPAICTDGAEKQQVISRLFAVHVTQSAFKVAVQQQETLSSEDVLGIDSVPKDQPYKNLEFLPNLGLPNPIKGNMRLD
jgi:hypothetical protein